MSHEASATPSSASPRARILVSRCLLCQPVRYDGGAHGPFDLLQRWQAEGRLVPLCPEVAGGLPTPRPPAEIPGGQGDAVLDGLRPVLDASGADVTAAFVAGARLALELVQRHGLRIAVLKARSPSCGNRETYDGSFGGVRVPGAGVTAALLQRAGVQVFSELELPEAARALAELEAATPR
ncbi:DUF523 domain-containing protein [Pseudomonas mangiferae]|uniref:DUF523 domain-containing protein n=1 Tax=Pseudomonas mangiferae TaxID=2593654 RepID=A0A553GTF7_9PSED|nr:DUF523 domain-containing protein [Pseudomonas mangiferae]TRX72798.1 DUF523 domain-containing protein [Pseudomonas mangiferae]